MPRIKMKIYRIEQADGTTVPMPTYSTEGACAFDLYSANTEKIYINPNENAMVSLGIKVEVPVGYQLLLFNRSGMATKNDCVLTTGVSIIDSDYRGEVIAPIKNHGNNTVIIEPFTRICQGQLIPVPQCEFEDVVSELSLSDTDRNSGSFGSTGTK